MSNLDQTLDTLVNFESGLITFVSEVPTQACEPDVQIYLAEFQDPILIDPQGRDRMPSTARQASGAGLTRTDALWSTVGEAVERYSALVYGHIERTRATAHQVVHGAEFLERIILFDRNSAAAKGDPVPFAAPDPDTVRDWVAARDILTDETAYVPASLALMKYNAQAETDILDRTYSTGLACHSTQHRAMVSALCELIERDAYSSYWLTGTPPLRLSPALVRRSLPDHLARDLDRLGFEITVLALRTDLRTPVIVSILKLPGGGIATGASCHLDPRLALEKAVVESFHTLNWCLDMKRMKRRIETPEEIDDFQDHVVWYLDPDRSKDYRWFAQDMVEIDAFPDDWAHVDTTVATPEEQVAFLAKRIGDVGFRALVADLTPPDIREAGFHVVRAFAAGLQPLSAGYRSVHTDPRRLEAFLEWFGTPRKVTVSIDPPHSFP